MDRPSSLLLGASDLTLLPLHQLVVFKSALMVSETSASASGSLEERLRGGKPSSRSGRSRLRPAIKQSRAKEQTVRRSENRPAGLEDAADAKAAVKKDDVGVGAAGEPSFAGLDAEKTGRIGRR